MGREMTEHLPILLLAVVLVLLFGWAAWPRRLFVVRIQGGQARVTRGKVTPSFLQEIRDACRRHGIQSGRVHGTVQDSRIVLGFSGGLSPEFRQQLRNLWQIHGWPPPSSGRKPRP